MKADTRTEGEVKALLEAAWKHYARKDLEGILALWTTDPDLTVIGAAAGAHQISFGQKEWRDAILDTFERTHDARVTIDWLGISAAGNVAWSAATLTVESAVDRERVVTPYYQTAICEKRDGTWRIMQVHLSRPALASD
ncbi:MAG: nuclear transport factor 2 family protein [Halobacteriota archaeon]